MRKGEFLCLRLSGGGEPLRSRQRPSWRALGKIHSEVILNVKRGNDGFLEDRGGYRLVSQCYLDNKKVASRAERL